MNKIYKVVWSRVKHTYVVASELAKSHTKSETTGTGIGRKLILAAALVCALSAFGSAVPTYGADAGTAGESQYVAVLVNDSNSYYYTSRGRQVSYGDTRTFDGYRYHKETVSGETYWVRDGYTIKYEEDKRYPGARNANIIKAYKTDSYTASSDAGLLKSNQIMVKSSDVSTLTDVILDDVSGGTYVGATNSGNPTTPSSFNYMIKDDNGQYVDAGNTNFSTRFKAATLNADGTYSYNGEVISNDNLYVVNNTVGVFLTSSKNVYTGKVFGANNEVLVTTKGEDGKMYSYWGADTPDPNTTLADMTIGQFNQALEKVNNNSKAVAGDVIKDIRTTSKENGGTIDLVRRGTYNSATGEYEGDYTVGSGITVTSRGGTGGEDVKIHFSAGDNGFDVAAGSKVEAVGTKDAATGIIINGETYNIKTGQDYTAGKNITINGNEISATDTDTTYTAGDNVSISDDNVISAKNTTLAAGKAEKKGNSYIVKDTAGNEVTLEDVASESVVNETINTTKTDLTNVINEKDKLNVKYDNEMKNTVTLGGSDAKNLVKVSNLAAGTEDHDAVNFSQLKAVADGEDYVTKGSISGDKLTLTRALGGTVEVTGFQEYVEGKDSYVTNAELDGNILTIEQNNGKGTYQIDLSTFANSFSGTDYHIVPNPAKDSEGVYKPDKDGNIVLTVEDSKTGETTSVTLSDIAGMESVNTLVDQTKTVITNEYNTAINNAKTEVEEKIEEAKVHYFSVNPDNISGAGNYDNDGAVGLDSIAVGAGAYADGRLGAAAFGNRSNADGERALAVGYNAKAEGMDTIAIGYSNNDKGAKGTNSIAIGAQADADGTQTIIRGKKYNGTWGNATALGAYTEAGAGATAIGASSKARGWNSTAVGNRAEASAANGVALGNASSAMREADAEGSYDYVGYSAGAALSDGERNSTVWHANMGAVSIGNEDFKTGETDEDGNLLHFQYTRQLTGLAAGTADTDAVNVAQLKRSRVELADGLNTSVSYSNDETDGHVIYKVDVNTDGEVKQGDTHIVNGDTVYNALQDVGWTAAVNGETAKEVKKDDTLNFVDGDNISITNDNGNIKISTSGLASSGDIWTAQADGKDVKAVNQKVNFTGSDHIKVTGTDGQVQFEAVGLADTDFTNITEKAVTRITNIAKGEDRHIEAKDYAVDENGTVTMSYVDGNGKTVEGSARITGIAKSDLSNITNEGTTVINTIARNAVKVADGENTTVSKEEVDGTTTYKVNVSKAAIQSAVDVKGTDGIAVDSSVDEDGTKNYTVSAKLSGNFKIDEGSGNIDLAPVVKIGDKVTVDGTAGEIKGLTNTTLDAEGFATLGRAATEEQLKAVDEKAAAAKTIVENGKNVEVEKKDNDDGSSTYTVGLAEDLTLGDNAITLKGSDGSISAKSGDAALSFDKDGLAVSGTSGITRINGANAYIGKISVVNTADSAIVSGLSNTTTDYEGFADGSGKAATEEQLKEVSGKAGEAMETASKGWNLTTNKDEKKKAKVAPDDTVDISGDENIEVDSEGTNVTFGLSDNVKLSVDGSLAVGNSMLTSSYLDVAGYRFLSSSGINANNMRISNVAAGIYDTDAVNVSQLRDAVNSSQISINAGTGIIVEKTGSSYTIKTNIAGLSNEHGTVTVSTDSDPTPVTNSNTSTTNRARRMSVMLAANDQVAEESETTTSTGNTLNVKYSANEVTFLTDDGNAASVNDGEKIDFKGDGKNITTSSMVEGNSDTITFALNKHISVDSVTAANVTAANQIAINNGPTMSSNGIDMASQKITNLKAGEISETSTDAVNGSQLYATNLAVINNTENINSLSNSISKLDNRIDRVGAGAAALAALHPLDYDPDDKWDFAAGYGNYGSASAVAVGAYYRPNEKTMFSLGGSFGGGENMVNAGVSFKLGSGSNGTSTSKAVMAKKINSLNETIASQEAKLAEQDKKIEDQAVKIEKLEAMINKLLDDKK